MLNNKIKGSILGVASLGGGAVVSDSQDLLMTCGQGSETVLSGYHVCVPKEQKKEYDKVVKSNIKALENQTHEGSDAEWKQKVNGMKMISEVSKENKKMFRSKREFVKDDFTVNIIGSWVEGRENSETKTINYVTIFKVSAKKNGKTLQWDNGKGKEDSTNFVFLNQESLVPDGTKKEVTTTNPEGKEEMRLEDNMKEDANLAAQYEIVEALKKSGYIE